MVAVDPPGGQDRGPDLSGCDGVDGPDGAACDHQELVGRGHSPASALASCRIRQTRAACGAQIATETADR